jgi:hypothetical protein
MAKSLFQHAAAKNPTPSPYELIEPEIVHLQKGYSIRHGPKAGKKAPPWVMVIGFLGLAWLYLMDPIMHAWYKGEAARTYLYLHNYGTGDRAEKLAESQILSADDIKTLSHRTGSYQDYYSTPTAAAQEADDIIEYMNNVRLLHQGRYQQLDPVGRMRYLLFIRTNLFLPTSWDFLDPNVSSYGG